MAKKKKREYKGNTKPELIEKALAYLQPQYGDPWDEKPTSVELINDEYARVWFEYFSEDDPDDIVGDWSFSLAIPAYVFWGKKKRDKYLKEQKALRVEASKRLDEIIKWIKGGKDETGNT